MNPLPATGRIIVFCILNLIPGIICGQDPYFSVIPAEEEVNNSSLQCMIQDRQGFLIIGTSSGLFRYDGLNFNQVPLSDSLRSHSIRALSLTPDGALQIGTEQGQLFPLHQQIGKSLQLHDTPITSIVSVPGSGTNLFIATYGSGIFRIKDKDTVHITSSDGLGDDYTYVLERDSSGNIWAGTDGGITILDFLHGKTTMRQITSSQGLPDNIVLSLVSDGSGTMWAGMQDGGVCRISMHSLKAEVPPALKNWTYGPVRDLHVQDEKLWIATDDHGILVYDLRTHAKPGIYTSFDGTVIRKIRSVMTDNEGNIWILSPNALVRSPGSAIGLLTSSMDPQFTNVHSILCDIHGDVWFSNDKGLFRLRLQDEQRAIPELMVTSGYDEGVKIISIHQDRDGMIWAGTFGSGVYRFDPKTRTNKRFTMRDGLINDNVLSITGKGDEIWFATLGGASLCELPPEGSALTSKPSFVGFGESQGLGNNFIYKVFEDSRRRIWFGTDGNGITVREKEHFINYSDNVGLGGRVVYSITEEENGHTWFTTANAGVYDFDGQNFKNYGLKEGLSNLNVTGLAAGTKGEIYVIHATGIDILDPLTGRFRYLGSEVGVGDLNPDLNAVSVDRSTGDIWIGASRGIVRLSAGVYDRPAQPIIRLRSVRVFLEETDTLDRHVFSHNRNHFTFHFTGLWYKAPDQVRFQVMLEGNDIDWITTRDAFVTYASLAPGTYTFRVRASVSRDFSDSEVASYTFTIREPVWKTWWFITLVAMFAIGAVVLFILIREKRLKREQNLIRENILSQFETLRSQVNPHFLFNSFSTLSAIINEDQEMAQEYVGKLSQFFRNILEYRDKPVITLEEELTLAETYSYLQKRRFGPSFSTKIEIPKEIRSSFIPPLTLQMLLENTVKHNIISAGKPLVIEIFVENGFLVVTNPNQPKKSVEPSTGVGLQNIRNRYGLLSKHDIEVRITPERFSVYLPILKNTAL